MKILDYYLNQQNNSIWYHKFQSTSSKQSGKTFSYVNTNFRYLLSFVEQFEKFKSNFGKERKDWSERLPCGQESDKHRVINLMRAGFITMEEGYYFVTPKGLALMDLANSDLINIEKWILIFLLILDYKGETRKVDILKTTLDVFRKINISGVRKDIFLNALEKNLKISKKDKLFEEDIFWLISFVNDSQFLNIYNCNSEQEKNCLKEYVKNCSKDKRSRDLIAHKFVNSGAYNCSMFKDDINVLYFSDVVVRSRNLEPIQFFEELVSLYVEHYSIADKTKIMLFIQNHKSIYEKIRLAIFKEDF